MWKKRILSTLIVGRSFGSTINSLAHFQNHLDLQIWIFVSERNLKGGEGTEDINDSLEKDRPGGTREAKMSKLTDMQRMNIMRVDVEANRSIAQSQQKLAQLKEQELHMREEELQ